MEHTCGACARAHIERGPHPSVHPMFSLCTCPCRTRETLRQPSRPEPMNPAEIRALASGLVWGVAITTVIWVAITAWWNR